MTDSQYELYTQFCGAYSQKIDEWAKSGPELIDLQKAAAKEAKTPDYSFETPVVYNRDLDKISKADEIKLIVVGDNPGKDEQLAKNNRYLVGQAGKIAEGFFRRNPELNIDFRKNVIILNKTPVHSAKTAQLKTIAKLGGSKIEKLLDDSQVWMAQQTAWLQKALGCELWLVGYSELKSKGLFLKYRDALFDSYKMENGNLCDDWEKVFVFQHFSMNRFSIDLNSFVQQTGHQSVAEQSADSDLMSRIHELGRLHRKEIMFGF